MQHIVVIYIIIYERVHVKYFIYAHIINHKLLEKLLFWCFIIAMENRHLTLFIIFSLLAHLLVFYLIDIDKSEKQKKNMPIYIELIEKEKKPSKKHENGNVLSDRDMNLQHKREDTMDGALPLEPVKPSVKSKINQNFADTNKKYQKPSQKPGQKEDKDIKKEIAVKKNNIGNLDQSRNNIIEREEIKTPDIKYENTENYPASRSRDINEKERIKRILNPVDVINELAINDKISAERGEDSVNIQSIKFKYASYFYKFKRLLYQVWRYPHISIVSEEEGISRVKFSILKDGKITNIRLVQSSGYPDLDNAAVDALETMSGIPLPKSYKLNILHVDGYFAYNINRFYIY